MISIKGLNKYFSKGRQNELHVLNNVELELPERGMVAIFGKSGCGKTTLLNVIGGLDGFDSGSVSILDESIKAKTDSVRNKHIGYIFQNYNLNNSVSCFDNVADALRICGITDSEVLSGRTRAALAAVGMEKYEKRAPDTLSGGQMQRIAIARAIVKAPEIILADEPTGNLDEANTVMIMDLLKALSRDRLVILVTHEANLVDYYCDRVIEISDGKVIGIRDNENAEGFFAKDKNHIYLGELECHSGGDERVRIDYYGDKPEAPISLKVVSFGGKTYVKIDTDGVRVIDPLSEIKLKEGVYQPKPGMEKKESAPDTSLLTPIEGKNFGKLFDFRSSLKSGYKDGFGGGKKKKSRKLLRRCMCLFAAVMVFVCATFGTAIGNLSKAGDSYNHNVFYLYTPDADQSQSLIAGIGSNGIDYVSLYRGNPSGDEELYFMHGGFETFSSGYYDLNFHTNGVMLSQSLTEDMELLAGKRTDLGLNDILISKKMADALLEKSPYGYIAEYRDLIGMVAVNIDVDGRRCTVSGIVDSDETAFYLSDLAIAKRVFSIGSSLRITLASRLSLSVEKGKTILLLVGGDDGVNYPKVQSTVKINGVELTLEDVIERAYGYESWLEVNGLTVPSLEAYCEDILAKEQPELIKGSQEYDTAFKLCAEENYYFYQSEIYYKYVDAYCKEIYLFEGGNFELWLYVNHGVPEALYGIALPEDLYKAREYKRLHGEYPTPDELMEAYDSLAYPHEKLDEYYKLYENEFYSKYHYNVSGLTYLVSDEDYIAMSRGHGQTDPSAVYGSGYIKMDVDVDFGYGEPTYRGTHNYSLIHSTDPEATARWLSAEFSHLSEEYEDTEVLITPYDIFESKTEENKENIISSLITIGVMLVFMSICMYFIMRSAMMNRIKEIGIYRAIGVSRGNIIFRFATESLVVTTMTTFLGFLGTSAFVWVAMNMSSLMSEVFYYPLWLAAAVLIVLYGVSILCGVLPVLSLVRRSPSEILAKYDI